jgi:uncharacterized membrane protein
VTNAEQLADVRARIRARALVCSRAFERWHGWSRAANSAQFVALALSVVIGVGDFFAGRTAWAVNAALAATFVPLYWVGRRCHRKAQNELNEMKVLREALVASGEGTE